MSMSSCFPLSQSYHLRLFWRPPSSPPLHLVASRECGDTASLLQLAPEVSCDWWRLVTILASDWWRLVTILASDWWIAGPNTRL